MSGKQRLFFALWSPACLADALSDLQSELGCAGRPVARGRLHMTLLFVGVGERARVAEAGAQAAARAETVELALLASQLSPNGPEYEVLARWPLGAEGRGLEADTAAGPGC